MKISLLTSFLLFVFTSNAQLIGGEIFDSQRKMTSVSTFTIESFYEGYVVYEIAVNTKGEVTSELFIPEKSTVKSTPANIQAKNLLKSLTFEPGDAYPKFHHGFVRVEFHNKKSPKSPQH
jgi:hypothetical protein